MPYIHNNKIHLGGIKLLPYALIIGTLLITACSPAIVVPTVGAAAIDNSTPTSQNTPAAKAPTAPLSTSTPLATVAQAATQPTSNPKCDALALANYDMGMALAMLVNLTPGTNYSAYTTPDSPFYIDFKKLRSELDTLATLPDPSAADALIVGKPSDAVVYFNQLLNLAETDIKSMGKPFVDTSPSGVKLIGIDTAWEKYAATFGVAMENVCKDYTAPSDLFAGTPIATVDPQLQSTNDATMATAAAGGLDMLATLSAAQTAFPQPTETPAP